MCAWILMCCGNLFCVSTLHCVSEHRVVDCVCVLECGISEHPEKMLPMAMLQEAWFGGRKDSWGFLLKENVLEYIRASHRAQGHRAGHQS